MSDRFAERTFGDTQRAHLLALDWAAPTDSSPNYQKLTDDHFPDAISQEFADAFEFGYGLNWADIKKITFTIQGSDMYGGDDPRDR